MKCKQQGKMNATSTRIIDRRLFLVQRIYEMGIKNVILYESN